MTIDIYDAIDIAEKVERQLKLAKFNTAILKKRLKLCPSKAKRLLMGRPDISQRQRKNMIKLRANGLIYKDIASKYGVSMEFVRNEVRAYNTKNPQNFIK
jgi:Mor family transcriptional regulator